MKRILIAMTAVLCIALCGCTAQHQPASDTAQSATIQENAPYTQIDSEEAARLMQTEKDYIILDVRTEEEFKSGHIPNAICIPNETIAGGELGALKDKNQLILVYCRSGRRSKEAAQKLANLGYNNVKEFGGIIDWTGETVAEY
ncbi:rhodanese-like domain-containing protein [uncultured Ruminococcus sp.]|uniref:rhodanese-like domain-containing protein n=1 Tax=uncultured Ruminococcus sp. TaxID=165186 RepID=UPI00292EE04A|nr:rhodanese-like domain-containing protein [uncultured Ruminococcus sp.]